MRAPPVYVHLGYVGSFIQLCFLILFCAYVGLHVCYTVDRLLPSGREVSRVYTEFTGCIGSVGCKATAELSVLVFFIGTAVSVIRMQFASLISSEDNSTFYD